MTKFRKLKKNLPIFAAKATATKEATIRNLMVSPDYAIQSKLVSFLMSSNVHKIKYFLKKEASNLHL